ncbi:MAG: hypothetical protein D6814_11925 [Calditrichaeota bacterium]|nr:MAG: hypothetical protein D6814_11925 [Calditrichota bacterium]
MDNAPIDLRAIFQIIKRRRWLIIIPVVASAIAAYIRISTIVPVYQSTASILLGRNTYITASMSRVLPGIESQNRQRIWNRRQTITKQIYSKTTLGKLIDRAGLEPSQGLLEKAKRLSKEYPNMQHDDIVRLLQIQSLSKKIVVNIPRRGEYFEVGAKSTDPHKAYLIAKTLAEVFIEENLLQELSGVQKTLVFSNEQLKLYRKKLEQAEKRLRDYQRSMTKETAVELPITTENLTQVKSLISSISVDLTDKYDQLNYIEKQLGGLASQIRLLKTNKATMLKAQLIEKISQLAELMINFSWNSKEVLRLNKDIAQLKDKLAAEIKENSAQGLDGRYTPKQIDLAVQREIVLNEIDLLKQQKTTLKRLVAIYNSKQNKIPAHEINLQKLQAEVQKNREIYQTFLDQVQSMKIREAMQRTEAQILYRILDPAQIPVMPVNTNVQKIIILALMAGLGIGGGLVYVLELIDNSFTSVDEIEKYLGVMVIGTVPLINLGEQNTNRRKWAFPLVAISLAVIIVLGFVLLRK